MGSAALALLLVFAGAGTALAAKVAPVKVTMNQITPDGVGDAIGSITLKQTKTGVDLAVDLTKLSPGEHGFHVHEHGICAPADKEGKKTAGQAAGGHWDPSTTKLHKGPGGGGHRGDLPKLVVPENGKLKTKLTVEGLTLADLGGKALMIHAGGDNYSDTPKPLGGGGDRVVCGVIPGGGPVPPVPAPPASTAAPTAAVPPPAMKAPVPAEKKP
jgi:Cu-Zn family superoxide dismutase